MTSILTTLPEGPYLKYHFDDYTSNIKFYFTCKMSTLIVWETTDLGEIFPS